MKTSYEPEKNLIDLSGDIKLTSKVAEIFKTNLRNAVGKLIDAQGAKFTTYKDDAKSVSSNVDLVRTFAWASAIESLRKSVRVLSESDINEIWLVLTGKRESQSANHFQTDLLRKTAFQMLFDLNTGPLSFSNHDTDYGEKPSTSEREMVPGLNPQQKIFADGPSTGTVFGGDRPLDIFAKRISDENGIEGVYCIAGARGSGKSSILNRIEWFCRTWIPGNKPPLFLRVDLGCAFDDSKFLLDLLGEIARAGINLSQAPPYTSTPSLLQPVLIGLRSFGRWCSSNWSWLAILVLVGSLFQTIGTNLISDKLEMLPNLLLPLWIVVSITCAYRGGVARMVGRVSTMQMVHIIAFVVILLGGYIFHLKYNTNNTTTQVTPLEVQKTSNTIQVNEKANEGTKGEQSDSQRAILIAGVVALVCGGILIFFDSSSWKKLEDCEAMLGALQRRTTHGDGINISGLGTIGDIARFLLPRPSRPSPIAEQDAAFQHQQAKDFIRRCTDNFGRVVLLIDDVDVLQSVKFHSLFRVLRPLSKVPRVCVVVAVPEYFHYALRAKTLGDVHSTVREVFLLGNPIKTPKEWTDPVRELLASRCVVPVEGGANCHAIDFAITMLEKRYSKSQLVESFLSRREIIRATERAMTQVQNNLITPIEDGAIVKVMEQMREEYGEQESSLSPNRK